MIREKVSDPKKKASNTFSRTMLDNGLGGDFMASCDGITFGVVGGQPIHTGGLPWPEESQINWARVNSHFFTDLAKRLESYAITVDRNMKARK